METKNVGLVKFNIPEEEMIHLQNLNIKTTTFANNMKIRLKNPEEFYSEIIDNDVINFYTETDGTKQNIFQASWIYFGEYFEYTEAKKSLKIEGKEVTFPKGTYMWVWSWAYHPEEQNFKVKQNLDECLPTSLKHLSKNFVIFQDQMLASYFFAILTTKMNFENIYVKKANGAYHAFGLSKIKWLMNPNPILEKKLQEEIEKRKKEWTEEEEKKENAASFDWQNIIKLYSEMYKS